MEERLGHRTLKSSRATVAENLTSAEEGDLVSMIQTVGSTSNSLAISTV